MKILVAGDPASIHATRFVSLLQEIGYDVRLFTSGYEYGLEEHLRDTTVYVDAFYTPPTNGNRLRVVHPVPMGYSRLVSVAHQGRQPIARLYGKTWQPRPRREDLARIVRSWKPDIVFSLKMQNDGYTVCETKEELGAAFSPKWVQFTWGTDIEFFGKHPDHVGEHLPRIKRLLASCDFHMADTRRDVRQAGELGFAGVSLGDCLAHGGFDLAELARIRAEVADEPRDFVLVKGRQGGFIGKAFHTMAALQRARDALAGYRVKVMMPTPDVRGVAEFLSQVGGIECDVLPRLPYRELLKVHARSVLAVSCTDVDGTPSFLVEAMAMGAFPIHSDMESIREWVDDGVNGLVFPVDDIDAQAACIRRALADRALVDAARARNAEIAHARMDRAKIREHVRHLVDDVVLPRSRV